MPLYEFECQSCGDVQEVMQKISDSAPAHCPSCQGGPLVKLISRTGFILKGSGWYVTDFRDGGKKPSDNSVKSEAKSESESSSGAASEPAPAATPPAAGCGSGGCGT